MVCEEGGTHTWRGAAAGTNGRHPHPLHGAMLFTKGDATGQGADGSTPTRGRNTAAPASMPSMVGTTAATDGGGTPGA